MRLIIKLFFVIVIFAFISCEKEIKKGGFEGTILDNGYYVMNATIMLDTLTATTDDKGYFKHEDIPSGLYHFICDYYDRVLFDTIVKIAHNNESFVLDYKHSTPVAVLTISEVEKKYDEMFYFSAARSYGVTPNDELLYYWKIESEQYTLGLNRISHTFTSSGEKEVGLKVYNADGLVDSITRSVNVLPNEPPVIK